MQQFREVEGACTLRSLNPHHDPRKQTLPYLLSDDVNLFPRALHVLI